MLTESRLSLRTPDDFDFWRTAYSHGWCALPPFSHDATLQQLDRILHLSGGTLVHCTLTADGHSLRAALKSTDPLSTGQQEETRRQIRTCLRLDEEFKEFHAEARKYPRFHWMAQGHAGRMLRAPTVFEDAIKIICTTNCTWGLTTLMVTNLVQLAGPRFDGDRHAFPTPGAVAQLSERDLRSRVKAGYRAPYILELAERVATHRIDIESWRTTLVSSADLFKEMRSVKGIGPYAAGNLLKLVGRYDQLGLDSWVRTKYCDLYHRGRKVKDATIEKEYGKYGKWRGLFFWLEMTRDWHDDNAGLS